MKDSLINLNIDAISALIWIFSVNYLKVFYIFKALINLKILIIFVNFKSFAYFASIPSLKLDVIIDSKGKFASKSKKNHPYK